MNLCDCYVLEVLGNPVYHEPHGWKVDVTYNSDGSKPRKTYFFFETEEEALEIKPNWKFLA